MSPQPFPHLLPAEGVLWYRFLVAHGAEWDRFEYDVRLGEGRPTEAHHPDYIKRMNERLSKKRLDAVGYKGAFPTIFEVTPKGARTLVGALELYSALWIRTYPDTPPPRRAAVVGSIDPDVLTYLRSKGDLVYVVGEPDTAPA